MNVCLHLCEWIYGHRYKLYQLSIVNVYTCVCVSTDTDTHSVSSPLCDNQFTGQKTSSGSWLQRSWAMVSLHWCFESVAVQYIGGMRQRRNQRREEGTRSSHLLQGMLLPSHSVCLLKVPQPPNSATSWRYLVLSIWTTAGHSRYKQ